MAQSIYFIAIARLLGNYEYGILVGAAATVGLVSQYASIGSGFVFLRYVSHDHGRFREFWGRILSITLVFGTVIVLILWAIKSWLLPACPAYVLLTTAVGDCIGSQMVACCSQVFQAYERMKVSTLFGLIVNVLRALVAALLLGTIHHASAVVWTGSSLVISMLAAIVAIIIVFHNLGRPIFRFRSIVAYLWEGLIFSVSGSTGAVYNDIDKSMLGHYGMNAANGVYTMAYRIIDFAFMPIRSIHTAAFPRFFKLGTAEGISTTESYARRLLRRTAVIGLVGAAALMVTAPLIPHVVGQGFTQSVSALRWLCLIPFFRCFHLSAGDALSGAGYQSMRLLNQALAASFNFCLNLYLIPHYSWLGAAWASLATDGGLAVLNWTMLKIVRQRSAIPPSILRA
jgi:O-antigen/teichoic acid export membrane protein